MRCLDCKKMSMEHSKEQSKTGFAWCAIGEIGSFVSFSRPACPKFDAAEPEEIAVRIEFERKVEARFDHLVAKGGK